MALTIYAEIQRIVYRRLKLSNFMNNKYAFIIIGLFCFMYAGIGQSPPGFSFQSILKDSMGGVARNITGMVKCQILKNSAAGEIVFEELHSIKTNSDGIFSIIIGQGKKIAGIANSLYAIDWGHQTYYLSLKTAITSSLSIRINPALLNYTDIGTTQLWSVPFALFALQTNTDAIPNASIKTGNPELLSFNGQPTISNAFMGTRDLTISIVPGEKNSILSTDSAGKVGWVNTPSSGMVNGLLKTIVLDKTTNGDTIIPGNTIISTKIKIGDAKIGNPVFATCMDDINGFSVYNATISASGEITLLLCNYQEIPAILSGKKICLLIIH